jgi:hypothetical protein
MGDQERPLLEQLDFIYTPSRDTARDVAYLEHVLGAQIVFAIEAMGTRVAGIKLGESSPLLVLAGHLEGDRPILVYRVPDLASALNALELRGWERTQTLEIPQGPCCTFQTPGGHRIAVYQLTRPKAAAHFAGRRDF